MIKDRHGTLTAPRRDNGTQTKRETDQLWLSIGFTSLGHRARLIAVSAPLLSNTTHAGVAACTKLGLLPPEETEQNHESNVIPIFPGRSGSGEVPKGAVRDSKAQSNPAPCRVDSDAEAFVLALWGVLEVV
jgi:hypothetical protein